MFNVTIMLFLPLLAIPLTGLMSLPFLVEKTVKPQTASMPVSSIASRK